MKDELIKTIEKTERILRQAESYGVNKSFISVLRIDLKNMKNHLAVLNKQNKSVE